MDISLEDIYCGFVNSFNSFMLPGEWNPRQETTAILEYFRRLGISLGFYPWQEMEQHDLDWFDDEDNLIMHFETENTYVKANYTIEKMTKSKALNRIAILWSNQEMPDIDSQLARIEVKDDRSILIIARFGKKFKIDSCPVKAWLIDRSGTKPLVESYLVWPEDYCWMTMTWKI